MVDSGAPRGEVGASESTGRPSARPHGKAQVGVDAGENRGIRQDENRRGGAELPTREELPMSGFVKWIAVVALIWGVPVALMIAG